MKNMQVWPYYISEDIVWFSDLSEGGVYTYKWESEEIDCKIRADVLFRFGIFEIAALACWESFVFIFSEELNGPHIVYNNLDGKIKRFEGLKNGCGQIIHQAIVVNNILYVVPLEIKENIYVVNLKVWNNNNNNIKLTPKKIGKGIEIKTWLPKYYDRSLFIPEYGGRRVFCVTEDKVKIIHLDIPVELFTIGVFENEIWVAPLHGKRIFCMTLEGEIKEKVEALCGYGKDTTNIWEIFFRDEFVFFLYWKRPEIDIYNKKKKN